MTKIYWSASNIGIIIIIIRSSGTSSIIIIIAVTISSRGTAVVGMMTTVIMIIRGGSNYTDRWEMWLIRLLEISANSQSNSNPNSFR